VLAALGLSWELTFGGGLASENFIYLTRGRVRPNYGAFLPHEHRALF